MGGRIDAILRASIVLPLPGGPVIQIAQLMFENQIRMFTKPVVWLTGLSGSGKSTLARALEKQGKKEEAAQVRGTGIEVDALLEPARQVDEGRDDVARRLGIGGRPASDQAVVARHTPIGRRRAILRFAPDALRPISPQKIGCGIQSGYKGRTG